MNPFEFCANPDESIEIDCFCFLLLSIIFSMHFLPLEFRRNCSSSLKIHLKTQTTKIAVKNDARGLTP